MQLCDKPVPPEDTIKLRPKRYGDQLVNFDEIPEWVSYWYDVFFDCLFQCAHLGFVHPTADSSCADTKIIPCRASIHTEERCFRRDFCERGKRYRADYESGSTHFWNVYYLHSFVMKTMLFSNRKYSSIPFGE